MPGTSHQPLPVHVPARSREAGVEAAGQGAASGAQEVAEADDRIADLIRLCLETHGGQFDPLRISSKASGQQPGEEPIYSKLNKLLRPQGLRPFVVRHPEFSWTSIGPKGMLITWAPSSASASGCEQPVASTGATDANALPLPPPPAGAPPEGRELPPPSPPLPPPEQPTPSSASAAAEQPWPNFAIASTAHGQGPHP